MERQWKLGSMEVYRYEGFPKIWGTFLGVPVIRTIVYSGLYWGLGFRVCIGIR